MVENSSYFVDAEIQFDGKTYRLKKSQADRWVSRGNYWHLKGDPSSWLCESAFRAVRAKFKSLPQSAVLDLLAMSMEITVDKLISAIRWHENYVRWHDGSPDYRVLEPDA